MSARKDEKRIDDSVTSDPVVDATAQGQLFSKEKPAVGKTASEVQGVTGQGHAPSLPESTSAEWVGESKAVQDLLKDFRKLAGPLGAVGNLRSGDPLILDKIAEALKALPASEVFARAVDDLKNRSKELVERARSERVKTFKKTEAEFVRALRSQGEQVKETTDGWRIGSLEWQVRRERAESQLAYNREVVVPWTRTVRPQDLEKTRDVALKRLRDRGLDESSLPDLFWETFQECKERRVKSGSAYPNRVSLLDFYQELRLTMARRELAKKPDRKLSHSEFPKWAFLYNLDLYRKILPSIPGDKRLTLETGSQKEGTSIGVIVNGLDPVGNYEVVCYIRQG